MSRFRGPSRSLSNQFVRNLARSLSGGESGGGGAPSSNTLLENLAFAFDGTSADATYKRDAWGFYHMVTGGTVNVGAGGYEFDGNVANYVRRAAKDLAPDNLLGTLSGSFKINFNSVAGKQYIIGKDGNKASEYHWRVFFESDAFNIEFWDDVGVTDRSVQVGASITTGVDYIVCYGYDSATGDVWASIDGGTENVTSTSLTQGFSAGQFGLGAHPETPADPLNADLTDVFGWLDYRLTASDQALIASGAGIAEFDGNITYGFSWDCETLSSYTGRVTHGPVERFGATLSGSSPIEGSASALNDGAQAFSQIEIFNDSIQPFWGATLTEGRIDFKIEVLTYADNSMIFMFDGKTADPTLGAAIDNNNGVTIFFENTGGTPNSGLRMTHGLAEVAIETSGFDISTSPAVMDISMRWNRLAAGNTMELYVDSILRASTASALSSPSDDWINHITVMNDTPVANNIKEDSIVITADSGLT